MIKWNGFIVKNLTTFEQKLNYQNFPTTTNNNNNNTMSNIIYQTAAAMNNSDFDNSTYMYSDAATERSIYEVSDDFEQSIFGPKRDSLKIVIPVTVIYVLIFITGVIGNISTCIVIKKNRSMHTATNYYLFSLAISDFMLLLSGVPQEVYMTWYKYPYAFGEYFCVGRGIVAETSANATVLTITAFTVERYVAICHPFFGQAISKLSRAIRIIIIIWILSILTAIPQALQFRIVSLQGVEHCVLVHVIIKHSFQLSTYIFFFAPMSIIFVLYLLIGLRLYRSNVIDGGSSGNGAAHVNSNSKDLHRFRNDLPLGLSSSNSQVRRGRLGMKSTQSDTILYRYSGGTQVSAVRGRMNQFGTKRVLKMLVAVVICFFLCWAPFHAQRLIAVYGSSGLITGGEDSNGTSAGDEAISAIYDISQTTEQIFSTTESTIAATDLNHLHDNSSKNNKQREQHTKVYTVMTYISGVLYYLSTCINPLLYNLMSNKFRQAFKSILFGKKSSTGRRSQNSQRSMSRKPTTNSSSVHRGSSESEMQSKVSLLQTISNERKFTPQMIP